MDNIKRKLLQVVGAIVTVVLIGSIGYYVLYAGQPRFMDCVYMTVISLTGVGYGEVIEVTGHPVVQVFTMLIILFGMGVILYGISTMTALLIEGELSGILRRKRMYRKIEKLKNHYIVCGGGETGHPLIDELVKNREQVVLIEQDQEKLNICLKTVPNLLYVNGDATEDMNLTIAGIERAAGIIICLPSDKDTLYVTMTARMINPSLRIISRMVDPKLEPKLKKAGADRTVSPNFIGALRMASEIIRPTVVDFLDNMLRSRQGTLRINQIHVSENSPVAGKAICDCGLKDRYGLLVLGIKEDEHAEIEFNPSATQILKKKMALIVMGEVANIEAAQDEF